MRKVGCLVNMAVLIVGFLGGSVLKIDIDGVVKKKRVTSRFGLQLTLGGSLFFSGSCTFHISFVNISRMA